MYVLNYLGADIKYAVLEVAGAIPDEGMFLKELSPA